MTGRAPWFAALRSRSRLRVFDTLSELEAAGPSPSRGWPVTERLARELEAEYDEMIDGRAANTDETDPGQGCADPSGGALLSEAVTAGVSTSHDEMVCDRCGHRHGVVWFAPSDIWNAVMRKGVRANADEYGFCCPLCFIQLAEERGVVTTRWLVTPFTDGPVRYADQIVLRAANSHEVSR